jgi:hypothetical protein
MSDVVIWLIVGVVAVIVVVGLLMVMRSRKRRQSGSNVGLPDVGAVSADGVDKEQATSDPRPDGRNPSNTAGQPDQRPR